MGVYIPKMTMPRNCSFCPCARMNISGNGIECSAVDFYAENLMPQKGRMECCPLVEVKPHGRLIDADALKEKRHWTDYFCGGWEHRHETEYVKVEDIDNALTIIEAEDGE